jgi:hypothetical protein
MGFKPALTGSQWNRIARLLPENRRDRQMIEAVLYRKFSGQSLAEVSEIFGITKVRLHQWEHAIAAELPAIMAALRLELADALAQTRSGHRPSYYRDPKMLAAIVGLRLQGFRDALRGSR